MIKGHWRMERHTLRTSHALLAACMLCLFLGIVFGRSIKERTTRAPNNGSYDNIIYGKDQGTLILTETDMLLTPEQYSTLYGKQNVANSNTLRRFKRKAVKSPTRRWTNKQIPYTLQSDTFSSEDKNEMAKAIKEWEDNTCITFRPAGRYESNYVIFTNGKGCQSAVGMNNTGKQDIILEKGCRTKGTVLHEIGHAIGFYHEQNRPDRDNYIIIADENIEHASKDNFKIMKDIYTYNVPYDYNSIMHYSSGDFSINKNLGTIRTKDPAFQNVIGNRKGLSFLDIKLANLMYKCSENCGSPVGCPDEGFMGKDCKCWCPGNPVKRCDGSGSSGSTERPLVKTTTRTTVRPTIKTTLRPTMKPTVRPATKYIPGTTQSPTRECFTITDSSASTSTCKDACLNCPDWGEQNVANSNTLRRFKRKAVKNLTRRWTNKQIPYKLQSNTFSSEERNEMAKAIKEWEDNTCITFRPAEGYDSNYVYFQDGVGCSSLVGMIKGEQEIILEKGCRTKGTVLHEIGHAIGFYHEQNRPDRDNYIIIAEENIKHAGKNNFKLVEDISTYNVPYDYNSIMHYSKDHFSINTKLDTIRTKNPAFQNVIGNRESLSFLDIKLANLMYKCSENCKSPVGCPDEGFMGKDCKCWCSGNPVKRCDGSGSSGSTERPLVKTTTRATVRPTIKTTLRPTMKTTLRPTMKPTLRPTVRPTTKHIPRTTQSPTPSCSIITDSSASTSTCQDACLNCPHWVSLGYCSTTQFTKKNCPKACGLCEERNGQTWKF